MEKMYGTYLGFMFSDESAVGTGELKVVIDDQRLTVSIATGLELDEQVLDMADAQPIDHEEVVAMFIDGLDTSNVYGIKFIDGTTAVVIETLSGCRLILGGQPGYELVGPTLAMKVDGDIGQLYEEAIKELEDHYGQTGAFPRVATQGRAPRDLVDSGDDT